jgi:hypothetical protein
MNNYAIIGAGVSVCVLGVIAIGYNTTIVSNIRSSLGSTYRYGSNSRSMFSSNPGSRSMFGSNSNTGSMFGSNSGSRSMFGSNSSSNSMFGSNSNNPYRTSQTSLFGTRTNKVFGGTRKNKRL